VRLPRVFTGAPDSARSGAISTSLLSGVPFRRRRTAARVRRRTRLTPGSRAAPELPVTHRNSGSDCVIESRGRADWHAGGDGGVARHGPARAVRTAFARGFEREAGHWRRLSRRLPRLDGDMPVIARNRPPRPSASSLSVIRHKARPLSGVSRIPMARPQLTHPTGSLPPDARTGSRILRQALRGATRRSLVLEPGEDRAAPHAQTR